MIKARSQSHDYDLGQETLANAPKTTLVYTINPNDKDFNHSSNENYSIYYYGLKESIEDME